MVLHGFGPFGPFPPSQRTFTPINISMGQAEPCMDQRRLSLYRQNPSVILRRARALALFLFAVLISLILAPSPSTASVEAIDDDYYLAWGDYHVTKLERTREALVKLDMGLNVSQEVDVMLMDQTMFAQYQNAVARGEGQVDWYSDGSMLNIVALRDQFVRDDDGPYYLVIDNTNRPDGGATSNSSVDGFISLTIERPSTVPPGGAPVPREQDAAEAKGLTWWDLVLILALVLSAVLMLTYGFKPRPPAPYLKSYNYAVRPPPVRPSQRPPINDVVNYYEEETHRPASGSAGGHRHSHRRVVRQEKHGPPPGY